MNRAVTPLLLLAAATLCTSAAGRAQTPRTPARDRPAQLQRAPDRGTASLVGRVLALDTARPLKHARVGASSPQGSGTSVVSDDQGRFEITGLVAGRYVVTAWKSGFVALSFGQRRPQQPATLLSLQEGQRLEGVDLRLPRGSVITGHVMDEDGEPVPGTEVRAMRTSYQQGERTLVMSGFDQTDDRGEYRIHGLSPGDYVVSAVARDAGPGRGRGRNFPPPDAGRAWADAGNDSPDEPTGYAPTFYPGTSSPVDAGRVTLDVGQEAAGIDFGLQRVPLARVAGRVVAPSGVDVEGGMVALSYDGGESPLRFGQMASRLDSDGAFSIAGVPPGRYRLSVRAGTGPNGTRLYASVPLVVAGADQPGLSVTLSPGAEISGTVVFEGTGRGAAPNPSSVRIVSRSATRQPFPDDANASVDATGRFVMKGVPSGPRLLRVGRVPGGWSLKSAQAGGRDLADAPVEIAPGERLSNVTIVLTDRATGLSGVVRDARGEPAMDATVIAFSADATQWQQSSRRIDAVRPDQTGRYEFGGLPAGEYLVAVVGAVEQGQWFDPAFLESVRPDATRVELSDGEMKEMDLKAANRE